MWKFLVKFKDLIKEAVKPSLDQKSIYASNFTPRAQQVFRLANEEAKRRNHNFLGTEHLLLGLIDLGQGVAINIFQKMGLDLTTLRKEVEKFTPSGPHQEIIGNVPYTPRIKKVIALAQKEAKNLSHNYVGTEHLLLPAA